MLTLSVICVVIKENYYRLAIADLDAESAFFLPLCKECAKDLADEIISVIEE